MNEKINSLLSNLEEMKKCEEDVAYFYNNYIRKDNEPILNEAQVQLYISSIKAARDRRRLFLDSFNLKRYQYLSHNMYLLNLDIAAKYAIKLKDYALTNTRKSNS